MATRVGGAVGLKYGIDIRKCLRHTAAIQIATPVIIATRIIAFTATEQ